MALTIPAHVFVANLLHATVPLFVAGVLTVIAIVGLGPRKTPLADAMSYFNKALFFILAFYGLVTAFTGATLLTNYDSVASIFGIDVEALEAEFEAIHGAIDINTPTVVRGATVRDVQAFGSAMLTIVCGMVHSWYYVNGEYSTRFLTALLFMFQGVGLFLISRAITTEQIVFWSIAGGAALIAYFILTLAKSGLKVSVKTPLMLLPVIYLILHFAGIWTLTVIASPAAGASVTWEAVAWLYPGFHTLYIIIMPMLVYFTKNQRVPRDGKSYGAINNTAEFIARD